MDKMTKKEITDFLDYGICNVASTMRELYYRMAKEDVMLPISVSIELAESDVVFTFACELLCYFSVDARVFISSGFNADHNSENIMKAIFEGMESQRHGKHLRCLTDEVKHCFEGLRGMEEEG